MSTARRTARPASARAADARTRSAPPRAILKAEKGLGADGAVRLHRAARAAQGARCQAGRGRPARGVRRALRARPSARPTRRSSRSPTRAVVSVRRTSRASSRRSRPRSSWPARRSCRPTPRWQEAMRRRGVEDFSLAMVDPWASSYTGPEDDPSAAADRAAADLGALRAGRARLRAAGRGPRRASSTSTRWRSSTSPTTASSRSRRSPATTTRAWMVDAGQRARASTAPRTDVKPIEITQPEGPSFTVDGHARRAGRSGTCGSASRRARGSCCTRSATTRHAAADHLPRLARGDVRPLRRPGADAPLQERLRPGRVRRRLAGEPADARLRLRRRHPLLRRRRQRPGRRAGRRSRTRSACTRRTTGSRWKHTDFRTEEVEVRRLRRLVISIDRDRRQLRVRVLLVPLHRRHDRVRGQAHGRDLDGRARRPASGPRTARSSPPGSTARTTSTSSACGWTWRSTAPPTRSSRSTPSRCPIGPENPTGNAWVTKRDGAGDRGRGAAGRSTRCAGRFWRIENPEKTSALGDPIAYKLMPGENVAPMFAPDVALRAARRASRGSTCGSRRTTRASASRRATTPTSTRAATGLPAYAAGDRRDRGHRRRRLVHVRRPPRRRARRTGP